MGEITIRQAQVAGTVLHDDVAALEMDGFGVIELEPNLAVVHYGVVDRVGLVHPGISLFELIC